MRMENLLHPSLQQIRNRVITDQFLRIFFFIQIEGSVDMNTHWLANWFPASIDKQPAPPPKPYPFGPYLRPWQFLQNNSLSCSVQFVESNILLHIPIEFPNERNKWAKIRSLNFISITKFDQLVHSGWSFGYLYTIWTTYRTWSMICGIYNRQRHVLRLRIRIYRILGILDYQLGRKALCATLLYDLRINKKID